MEGRSRHAGPLGILKRMGVAWPVMLMARELGLGGSERQLTEIARALDPARFTVHVGCLRGEGFRAEELRKAGVPVAAFPVRSFRSPAAFAAAAALGRYIRRHGIRLVHAFDVPMNLFGVPVACAFQAPVVLSSQRAYRSLTPGLARHLLRITDRMVDAVVVNCRALQQHLIEEERTPADLIRVCYNGIDTARFRPERERRPETAAASVVIGTVCALRPEKGLATLMEAFARLSHPGAQLVIVGSGPELPRLEASRARMGLEAACTFVPATGEVAEWLRAIDLFVLPSLSEALSNALMEAMASGCCAVATRVGGNPELVADGETGALFEPADAADLARKLAMLIAEPDLRCAMARRGADFVRRNFSLDAARARMAEIYTEFLERRG